ncbi:hypothetical protein TNCV_760081 [Trichonephila clavipes]|nr:hypothetical protein TNCV_760081 [Trichonephila clavipes]
MDPRDVIYMITRPRTPTTDRLTRRPPHRTKCTRTAIQARVAPSLRHPVSPRIILRRLSEGHLGSWHPLRVLPLTPPFGVVPRPRKLDGSGVEPGDARIQIQSQQ